MIIHHDPRDGVALAAFKSEWWPASRRNSGRLQDRYPRPASSEYAASLATRSTDGEALETERLKAKLGEMLLERELLEAKIAALEAKRPLARRRSRP